MRLVITQNITADGVIEAIDEWFSPASDGTTQDIEAEVRQMMARESALLLGRVTFEAFRGYWPRQTADTTGITAHLNRVPKHVVSGSLDDPGWEHTTVIREAPLDAVRALKARPGENLGVTGSITLCHALIGADLVDEYNLFMYPIVLGRGRRLFQDGIPREHLQLLRAVPFQSGIVLLTYERRRGTPRTA
jgi:dihydrofolate reductase